MNARQKQAALHARELRQAKEALLRKVNIQLQSARKQGYHAEVTPQLSRLLDLGKYRQRDVVKINQLVNNAEKLKEYIAVINTETGEIISGEKALTRYGEYERSGIYRPAQEREMMVDAVSQAIEDSFVDESVLNEFKSFLNSMLNGSPSAIDDSWWRLAHPDWGGAHYRGNIEYAKQEMIKANMQQVYEIRDALEHLISVEGTKAVEQRVQANFELLQDATIMAAIGYKNAAASALQQALKILLPEDRMPGNIRHRISDMAETIEGQFEEYEE